MMLLTISALLLATHMDACHVLTKRDIAAVQGEPFTAVKLTAHDDGSQCFYQLPTFTKSVSVDVIRDKEFWQSHFHEGEKEHEEEATAPREIEGVGDDALWIGGRMAGSLYVRKGDAVLRVSVGGPGNEKEKIAKAKTLAARALKRL
ncbi:MAG TPA: hypothetical protein VJ901_22140 [Thermoanaerobaculia bacterium]|nr:hypothetical protein [Thermoanaerobaculia bacterium]